VKVSLLLRASHIPGEIIMITVVGIFGSRVDAERAAPKLEFDLTNCQINILTPGPHADQLSQVPTMATEQPGVGKAFGGLVGGALGAAAGMQLGVSASLVVPGVGPVIAVGVAAAALLGLGGAVGGAAVGEQMERSTDYGLPKDELFVYEDALRKGRTVVLLLVEDEIQEQRAKEVLSTCGAESLNAARENWWIGLRDAEAERYTREGGDFNADESVYRLGFEAAQQPALRGRSYSAALDLLQKRYPLEVYNHAAFRRGFERGQVHHKSLNGSPEPSRTRKPSRQRS
jgi:hypothetical protein